MFDQVIIVDWSARATPSPRRPSADAIWICRATQMGASDPQYLRTRATARETLSDMIDDALGTGQRTLIGFDFPFGYPRGFAAALTGRPDALTLWAWLAERVEDAPDNRNNRFELAAEINRSFPGIGPFWGCPANQSHDGLSARGRARTGHGLPERREVETVIRSAQPCWKLFTTGSVGSQVLLGLPVLEALRQRFGERIAVWPFETRAAPITLAEIYPSLLAAEVDAALAREGGIKDAHQVRLLARALAACDATSWARLWDACPAREAVRTEEGWILGVGAEDVLRA